MKPSMGCPKRQIADESPVWGVGGIAILKNSSLKGICIKTAIGSYIYDVLSLLAVSTATFDLQFECGKATQKIDDG